MFAAATYVPCALFLETQQLHAHVDAPVEAPTTDGDVCDGPMAEQDDGAGEDEGEDEGEGGDEGEGEGDEEDQTEPEAEAKEDEDVGWMT